MGTEKNTIKVIFFKATIVFSKQPLYLERLTHTNQAAMCRAGAGGSGSDTNSYKLLKQSFWNKQVADDTQEGNANGAYVQQTQTIVVVAVFNLKCIPVSWHVWDWVRDQPTFTGGQMGFKTHTWERWAGGKWALWTDNNLQNRRAESSSPPHPLSTACWFVKNVNSGWSFQDPIWFYL